MTDKRDNKYNVALNAVAAAQAAHEAQCAARGAGKGLYAVQGEAVSATEKAMTATSKASGEALAKLSPEEQGRILRDLREKKRGR